MLTGSHSGSVGSITCNRSVKRLAGVVLVGAVLSACGASPGGGTPSSPVGATAGADRSDDGPPREGNLVEAPQSGRPVGAPQSAHLVATKIASGDRPVAAEALRSLGDAAAITAVEGYEKIREKTQWDAPVIGLIRAGQSVRLRSAAPLRGNGVGLCAGGWYAVEPRGFVCLGPASTLANDDPRALAAAEVLPDASAPYPFHYGVSVGAPRYHRIPSRAEQRRLESGLDRHLANLPAPDDALGGAVDARPAGVAPSPAFLRYTALVQKPLVADEDAFVGMKVSWAREFDAEGRTWLETPDLTLIPKDKVRTGKRPDMHGVDLRVDKDFRLPLAFLWLDDVPKLTKDATGNLVESGESWPRHGFVPVTETLVRGKGGLYVKTRDGHYLRSDLVTVIRSGKGRPKGVGPKDKWVSVKVTRGYLVAYEGDTPVYATAVSPGIDGILPREHATRRGQYTVGWKMLSADMAGEEKGKGWLVDEVPFVAYYKGNYALHGAFWHDEFGRPKSHGCVNLAPADAQFLFRWMDPALPEGWYAAAAYYPHIKGTAIDVQP